MKNFLVVGIIAVAVFAIVVLSGIFSPGGAYAYRCDDGAEFSMTPAEDGGAVTL